jgi:hypothetical protein
VNSIPKPNNPVWGSPQGDAQNTGTHIVVLPGDIQRETSPQQSAPMHWHPRFRCPPALTVGFRRNGRLLLSLTEAPLVWFGCARGKMNDGIILTMTALHSFMFLQEPFKTFVSSSRYTVAVCKSCGRILVICDLLDFNSGRMRFSFNNRGKGMGA